MKGRSYVVIAFLMLMVAQTLLIFTWGEPYPSIALPRVAGTVSQQDTITARREVFFVQTSSEKQKTVFPSEVFHDAPPNLRKPIPSYLRHHLQYREGPYLDQATKTRIRNWLVERLGAMGISEVRRVYGASIETRHPICPRCDHSNVRRDTSLPDLLFRQK